jgi:hypothetical protein
MSGIAWSWTSDRRQTLSFPVGETWFVAADSRSVSLQRVAKVLHGKVKTYRYV